MNRLIDRMSFDIVQNKLKSRQRSAADRGNQPVCRTDKMRRVWEVADDTLHKRQNIPKQIYSCKTYNAYGKQPLYPAP